MPTDGDDTERTPAGPEPALRTDTRPAADAGGPRPPSPGDGTGTQVGEPHEERLLRRLLGADRLALGATRRARLHGWLWPLLVTAFGGVLRFWDLSRPRRLVFDETYYVKQGWSMAVLGYEGDWPDEIDPAFERGDVSSLSSAPEYVVHPPVGKWLIGLGIRLGGVENPWAWRLAAAVLGTLAILMIARIARRLFASTLLGTLAGLFLAVDGQAIVHSRTSLLDPFLMFFALAAFGCLLLDREQARRRLAVRTAALLDAGDPLRWGPGLGFRWWRLAAGVLLGLAIGTKWSGLYFLAVFGLLTVAWDATARRSAGVRPWVRATLVKDAVVAFVVMVPTALLTYVASWAGWFASDDAWDRHWAENNPGQGVQWLPPVLRSLWSYHSGMWNFHKDLAAEHPYAAHPLGWIVQWRPTSYHYPAEVSSLQGDAARAACGADSCAQAVLAVGNPVIWWCGAAAILVALFWLVRFRDWRAGAVLAGLVGGWVPWFAFAHRTIFTFYSVAFVPWVVLTLVYVLGLILGPAPGPDDSARDRRGRTWALVWVGVFSALVVAVGLFFYPIWAGWVIPRDAWQMRMWLSTWI